MNQILNFRKTAVMKLFVLSILFALFPKPSHAQDDDTTKKVLVGNMAPNFKFFLAKDKKASLSDYKGKIVLLDFWATWCEPCRRELPLIQNLYNKFKNDPHFELFAFARGEDWNKTIPFKEQNHYTFPMLPDKNRKIFDIYARADIPRIVVIGKDGKVIYTDAGYDPKGMDELMAILTNELKEAN
ncbi:TlpA family protein disulfide reductase [Mucilaginibacter kameinonensis]|uniref:TlpA family protein disulfide reductase n=1 Tax=Mucilaginibacter kameinonensis TaxID=452286 RepID=UPI000EF759A3|nr:TlpA family protein disulfide reductase [Mucilaginibacter kameinonensis]